MRFGKVIRYMVSLLFVLQMLVIMAIALYGSVLALSSVTNLSMTSSIFCMGVVCIAYCSVGGLKAVLWTDTLQACFMIICLLSIYIAGIQDAGGISNVYNKAREGGRFDNILDLRLNFLPRYNFWAVMIRCLVSGMAYYGTHQLEMQRILSLSDVTRAKSTLKLCAIPTFLMYFICGLIGIVLYAVYSDCDPILNKKETGLVKYDQLVPAYIVSRFSSIPGMTGLCIVGIFSASLSSISSCLNCASTVTVVDFVTPIFGKKNMTDRKTVWLAKILCIVFGAVAIGLSFLFLSTKSLKVLAIILITLAEGPVLAVFLVGVLSRKANDKIVSIAFVIGLTVTCWLSFGSLISRYEEPTLPMKISGCSAIQNGTISLAESSCSSGYCPTTPTIVNDPDREVFVLYKISYMWFPAIGLIVTLTFMLFAVLLTGWRKNSIPADSKCLSPVTRFWMKPEVKTNETNSEIK